MTIGFDLGHDPDLEFSRSYMEFAISQKKWSDCHETKSKHIDWTLGLKCDHRVWPWPWPWPWIFKVIYGICYISEKMVRLPWNKKQAYWLNSRPEMWPSGLTLAMTFQGQIWNLLYLNQKWSDCHEKKSKYIDWTPGLRCDHWVWPWPWPLNF